MEEEEEDDEVPPTVLFENVGHSLCQNSLAFMTKIGEWFGFGRHGQLLAKATLAYAQLTRSLRGPYADVRAQLCKNQSACVKLEYIIPVTLLKTSLKKTFKVSLRHPYDSNVGKKCLRRLTPTSVLLTPQVLTRIPILNTNTEV